jgi:quinoprotein glucose dehydrogenase
LKDSWATNGNTGVWTQITVDEDVGFVYLPVEDPTSDQYGGHRPGNNLFADTLVCVDLKTGVRKWHFQVVHHPMWDYDLSSAPLLADITVNGRAIKAVALPSKESYGRCRMATRRMRSAIIRRPKDSRFRRPASKAASG